MERRIRHPVTPRNRKPNTANANNSNNSDIDDYFTGFLAACSIVICIGSALVATIQYREEKPIIGNMIAIAAVVLGWVAVYLFNNWRSEVNRVAVWLSYIYNCLTELLNYIYFKMATLDIRVAKYQNLDTYLEIFHFISGGFHIAVYAWSRSLTYKLVYVQIIVFTYQVLKWIFYNIYPELVKLIVEYIYPVVKKFVTRALENIKWLLYITLVNTRILYACTIYVLKLAWLFWIPVVVTAAVITLCVMY